MMKSRSTFVEFWFSLDGAWSGWSSWSDCSATCGPGVQRRTRTCTSPAPANGGKDCPGAPAQKADCVSECPVRPNTVPQAKYDGVQLTEEAEGELHAALYVGLGVAFSVFSLVAVLLVRVLRRRGRRGRRAYTEASTDEYINGQSLSPLFNCTYTVIFLFENLLLTNANIQRLAIKKVNSVSKLNLEDSPFRYDLSQIASIPMLSPVVCVADITASL
ncbi:netrin receptor UNC5C-like [Frankliniella occidentalis]|uniref:Netrin receptor UNC5C-like n=1 Tax=Frankliniella occidentalis TaxID=133901 RepID=A0A9C6WZK4_FRAOC|nr:netrin receptor UNC5C-like [Frankliniella occidentalis]